MIVFSAFFLVQLNILINFIIILPIFCLIFYQILMESKFARLFREKIAQNILNVGQQKAGQLGENTL